MSRIKYINSSGVNSFTIGGDPGATLDGGNGDLGAVDTNSGPPFAFAIVVAATGATGATAAPDAATDPFIIGATAAATGAATPDFLYFFIKSSAILVKFEP